jgi:hypothetical protein
MKGDWDNDREIHAMILSLTPEDARILLTDCPQCKTPFNLAAGFDYYDPPTTFCSELCAHAHERAQAPLVKPQPKGVNLNGWDI